MILVKISDQITKFLMILGAGWAFFLCFFILADILMRALNMPISGTKEIVANSVVMIIFLQIGFTIRSDSMLRADFLVNNLPKNFSKIVFIFALLLGAAFFFFLMKAGIKPAVRSFLNWEFDGEGALRVPVWPTSWMIVLGAGGASLNYLIMAVAEIYNLRIERLGLD